MEPLAGVLTASRNSAWQRQVVENVRKDFVDWRLRGSAQPTHGGIALSHPPSCRSTILESPTESRLSAWGLATVAAER